MAEHKPEINLERRIKRHVWAAVHDLFAVTAPGLEEMCAAELTALGADGVQVLEGGVAFQGRVEMIYAANLHLRTAGRVLLRLKDFRVRSWADLLRQCAAIPWEMYLPPDCPLSVRVTLRESNLRHEGRIVEEVIKAAGDALRALGQAEPRPANHRDEHPMAVQVRGYGRRCSISLDTSGEHLHKRGYRLAAGKAPLREDLAAALLLHCGYDGTKPLLDPMCGAGTLPIEAALMASRAAPGLGRGFAFEQMPCLRAPAWDYLRRTAGEARRAPVAPIMGSDKLVQAVQMATGNAQRAGVEQYVSLGKADFLQAPAPDCPPGLLVLNPPYGKRLGSVRQAEALCKSISGRLRSHYAGWQVGMVLYLEHWADLMGLQGASLLTVPHGGARVSLLSGRVPG